MSEQISLAIRPCLAFPMRWSVDFWRKDRVEAAYQVSLPTFDTLEQASAAALEIKRGLEEKGVKVTLLQEGSNASRSTIRPRGETEQEITKHLEAYVKSAFSPLVKFSLASLFDISNWVKGVKAIANGSPHLISLLILAALFLRGPFERLLGSIIPKELELNPNEILASAPLLLAVATLHVYMKRSRLSNQLDRVRQWILQAVTSYNWDHNRVRALVLRELGGLEYASVGNMLEQANRRDPSSFSNLAQALSKKTVDYKELTADLLRDDFARKIQALAGMAAEPDYRPKQMAVFPLHLLVSLNSVKSTILGLLSGRVSSSKDFHEGMTLLGMMLGLILGLVVILPSLLWTTALSWHISPMLFLLDVIACALTVLLLTRRPLAVAVRRSFVPKGLALHECVGAFNVM